MHCDPASHQQGPQGADAPHLCWRDPPDIESNNRLGFSGFRQEHIAKTLNAATPNTVNIPKARPITKIPSYPFHPAPTSSLPGSSVSYIFSCVDSQSRDVRDPQLAKRTAVGAVSRPCEAGLNASNSDTNCAKHRTGNTMGALQFLWPFLSTHSILEIL